MIAILSSSLERQARIAEQNADRVAALGDRVDAMGEKVSAEIGEAMRHQTKVLSALVLIALVLLGGAAGVSFMGDGFGVSIGTANAKEADDKPSVELDLESSDLGPDADPVAVDRDSDLSVGPSSMAEVDEFVETGPQID